VAVYGIDGKEYYGKISALLDTPEKSFKMQWLAPDKDKFKAAFENKVPITPSDFRPGTTPAINPQTRLSMRQQSQSVASSILSRLMMKIPTIPRLFCHRQSIFQST
jgi:hypothetical protein